MTSCIPTDPHKNQWAKGLEAQPTGDGKPDNRWCEKCGYDHVWERLYDHTPIQPPGQNTPCRDNFHAWEKGQTICNCGKCTATFQPTGQSKEENIKTVVHSMPRDLGDNYQPNTDSLEEKLRELLKGSYACSRVWEAWQYGTMRQDDFYPLEEDDDVISDLAQLFNKYAREQEIEARLDEVVWCSNHVGMLHEPWDEYEVRRKAQLKEQRAKLKENNK